MMLLDERRIEELAKESVAELLMRSKPGEIDANSVVAAIRTAVREAGEAAARIAMDMPLNCQEDRHEYRWSDTAKAVALDISSAIRKRLA